MVAAADYRPAVSAAKRLLMVVSISGRPVVRPPSLSGWTGQLATTTFAADEADNHQIILLPSKMHHGLHDAYR